METTVSLDSVLDFINSMSLSHQHKRWLGERLIAEAKQERTHKEHKTEKDKLFESLVGAWKNDPSTDGIEQVILEGRQNDYDREIVSFDD